MESVRRSSAVVAALLLLVCVSMVRAEDPYLFFDWNVTYGTISPLGVPQQGILINGQFPGPKINCTSNNNIVVNVFNNLDEPFLLTWNGIQQRKNSWQDGTPGTMCPIMPGTNFTYRFQVKDQIGSYYYFPTTGLHKASGAIGALQVHSRLLIPVPFDEPADEFAVLMGDWPDGIQINGKSGKVGDNDQPLVTMEAGKTYRYRVCNVGLKTSLNFRIQGHTLKLVELEGSHTVQNVYDSLDVHVGQCMSVLVTANQEPKDYYMVASSRFTRNRLLALATIRYANGKGPASTDLPAPPARDRCRHCLVYQPVPVIPLEPHGQRRQTQPSGILPLRKYQHHPHYQARQLQGPSGRQGQGVQVRHHQGRARSRSKAPGVNKRYINGTFRNFVEIILENPEKTIQTYHLDGYSFFAVGMEPGKWSPDKRKNYNLVDAVSRYSIQVYPGSWTAIMTTLDNAGMWNLRSEMWENAYLGQQLYVSVLSPARSLRDEYNLPDNTPLCGIIKDLPKPPPYSI
ncbi:SKU5 similar 11 [Actinidia rufa]|uniref:SKU5 similar 11 n=1 Tax=Actinidia rufa TaxID=165716 RepID=A0A7J0FKM5_9ERIC|nr:SKU5 similar 11 [Actinidia rufa]